MISLKGLLIPLILVLPFQAYALSAVDVSDEQLTQKAEMIVIGRVLSAYSEKDTSSGDIFTYITVRVSDQLKGKSRTQDIVLKTAGGRVGEEFVTFPGAADFYKNEEVLLFLERRPDRSLMPIGMVLGKYSVYRDSETGKRIVYRHMDGSGQYYSTPRGDTVEVLGEKLYLNEFRERIQKIVGTR